MPLLTLKPNHKAVTEYYRAIEYTTKQLAQKHEGAVAPHFAKLLSICARQVGWTLSEQYSIPRAGRKPLRADGALLDHFNLRHGIWEAKDIKDDLDKEKERKFAEGYPRDNILFQTPDQAILVQGKHNHCEDITRPQNLVSILKDFFRYQPRIHDQWTSAVLEFKDKVPELARNLLSLIKAEYNVNRPFREAQMAFKELIREAINPNISDQTVEEMFVQHLLTERIFRKVFDNPEFAHRNIIAREIEKVIATLTSRYFSRQDFLKSLDRFYIAIEATAATRDSFSEKQSFLNAVYENFFQGFSTKMADTHGIVYTPQPIVEFMVRSVDDILRQEFGKADGLASDDVAILDPFVGTGNFVLRIMQQIPKSKLTQKYRKDILCNEVMLLPYYIASMNIEHEYAELVGRYEPFEGISLVDTFELAEGRQMPLFAPENTKRVQRQKESDIFVVIGNPPYNAHQISENDNSKNRVYKTLSERISETYGKASRQTNKVALSDAYIKAFRWASDRIGDEGILAFVTNNGFLDGLAFDGMRKHLAAEFDTIYILDLGGNVRKNPMLSGTTHNVFGIQVGVSITFLVKHSRPLPTPKIFYACVDEFWRRGAKCKFLDNHLNLRTIEWQNISPNEDHVWFTQGLQEEFGGFVPVGSKEAKAKTGNAIFANYGRGIATSRDTWLYNFRREELTPNVRKTIAFYNKHVFEWHTLSPKPSIDDFVTYDEKSVSWSLFLKNHMRSGIQIGYMDECIRRALYRPFTKQFLYFDKHIVESRYQMPTIFPVAETEKENFIIYLTDKGSQKPFMVLMTNHIADLHAVGAGASSQCFPFYTYDKNGRNRQENITDWALAQFRNQYPSETPVSKWDIFYYIYTLLHHPDYRTTYAANLRRELPRIPFVDDFWCFVQAGKRLAELHVDYEQQPQYQLTWLENRDLPLDFQAKKMRLSKDKTSLKYNDFLTLSGIPPQVFEYKLGNRSALDWVIDQYQVSTDPRNQITNDPNREDDETYILRLIGQVITVSLETVNIINNLPPLEILSYSKL